jgi:hypothetical protein
MLPMSDAQKAKLTTAIDDPRSILPPEAHQAIAIAQNANAYNQQAIASLPISDAQKATLSSTVQSLQTQAQQRIEQSPIGVQLKSVVGSLAQPAPVIELTPVTQAVPAPVIELTSVAQPVPVNLVPITISADDLADVQALLAAKQQGKQ